MRHKVLVVAAHPDDEVLGCGATIRRLANEKEHVYIAIMGEGIASRDKAPNKKAMDELKKASCKAAKLLGAKDIFFFDFPDNKFDTVPRLDIVKKIESLIKKIRPTVIFTHNRSDLNIDHQISYQAVLTATRPVKGNTVKEIYMFETPSSTEWSFGQLVSTFADHLKMHTFSPNVFYDVSKTINTKVKALNLYKSEIRPFPHPRSPKALIAVSRRWGSVSGFNAAEAFELLRILK